MMITCMSQDCISYLIVYITDNHHGWSSYSHMHIEQMVKRELRDAERVYRLCEWEFLF